MEHRRRYGCVSDLSSIFSCCVRADCVYERKLLHKRTDSTSDLLWQQTTLQSNIIHLVPCITF